MIIGVGIDVAEIERFAASVQRTPALLDRLFVPAELVTPVATGAAPPPSPPVSRPRRRWPRRSGRRMGLLWTDCEVYAEDTGRPRLRVRGTVAARAAELGVTGWHVSLSHDAGVASAVVIAEG